MPNEDRLTRADLEKLKEFAKKNRGKIFQKTDQKPVYLKKNKNKLFGKRKDQIEIDPKL
jgi:hypothetical protein